MTPIQSTSTREFAHDVEQRQGLTLVDFHAPWCTPCKLIEPTLEQLASEFAPAVHIVKVDVDEHPEVLAKYGVRSLPTLILFADGRPVDTRVGAHPAGELRAFVGKHAA